MDESTKQAIFDELMRASGVRPQQERHFTITEFAASQGIKRETGARILVHLLEQGRVGREKILTPEGKQAWGYFVVE